MSQIKLGVVLESFGLPVRAALTAAAKAGVRGVQVDAVGDLAPDRLGDTGRREFRTLLRSFDLELAAVGCPLRHGLDTFEHQQQRLDHVKKAMQLAFDLGARKVVVPLPRIPPEPATTDTEPPKPFLTFGAPPPRSVTLRESLLDLGGHGDRTGVTVCLEAGLDSGEATRDYLGGFDSGSLGVTFDPANFLVNGHDPIRSVMALTGKVTHSHARDARTGNAASGPQEVAVGAGEVEWMSYLAALAGIEYGGFVCVERSGGETRAADTTAGVGFLRRFVPGA